MFLTALAALSLAVVPAAGTASAPLLVFVLAGQSNIVGRAASSDGTPGVPSLLLFRNGAWAEAQDPLGAVDDNERGVGPGMTFGLDVLSHLPPGTKIGLVMCGEGGSTIADWQPDATYYRDCKADTIASSGVVAGFLFLEGETEARNAGGASRWAHRFPALERQVEADFGPIPFLLGQISTLNSTLYPYQQAVRDAQAAAAEDNPEITLVVSDDLPIAADGVHFTAQSYKILGTRFGEAWWSYRLPKRRYASAS